MGEPSQKICVVPSPDGDLTYRDVQPLYLQPCPHQMQTQLSSHDISSSWALNKLSPSTMEDDFYAPLGSAMPGAGSLYPSSHAAYLNVTPLTIAYTVTALVATMLIATRLLSERKEEGTKARRSVWRLPYWVPGLGHLFS